MGVAALIPQKAAPNCCRRMTLMWRRRSTELGVKPIGRKQSIEKAGGIPSELPLFDRSRPMDQINNLGTQLALFLCLFFWCRSVSNAGNCLFHPHREPHRGLVANLHFGNPLRPIEPNC